MRIPLLTVLLACALAVAGCRGVSERQSPARTAAYPQAIAPEIYSRALSNGQPVYRVRPGRSRIVVRVYRDGPLARLGHDHVISTGDVRGLVLFADEASKRRTDLFLPLDGLEVDDPDLRKSEGLDGALRQTDIEGTRRNMLEKVLEAERFPGVLVRASGGDSSMEASITLHGLERRVPIPVQIDSNETVLNASGEFAIRHTDFGMTPFSVFGGALAVKDRIDIRFHIVAERVRDGDALAAPD